MPWLTETGDTRHGSDWRLFSGAPYERAPEKREVNETEAEREEARSSGHQKLGKKACERSFLCPGPGAMQDARTQAGTRGSQGVC